MGPVLALPALAGLLAVAGAGYFCTRAVTTLFQNRTQLARIVPHPVSFSASSSETATPRSSVADDSFLKSRPLSPDSISTTMAMEDRGTSPFPGESMDRSTSMSNFAQVHSVVDTGQQTAFTDDDDAASMTSAADAIDAQSVSSLESSDLGSVEMKDNVAYNRQLNSDLPMYRSMSPDLVSSLAPEFKRGSLRERAHMALRAANAATEAAQR